MTVAPVRLSCPSLWNIRQARELLHRLERGRIPNLKTSVFTSRGGMSCRKQEKSMSRGLPSMTALLGLLAIAGYQNRDKTLKCSVELRKINRSEWARWAK